MTGNCQVRFLEDGTRVISSCYSTSKTVPIWTSDIFVIKRTAMQLLSEFIRRQKLRFVGVGVTKLRVRDERQTLITDFP